MNEKMLELFEELLETNRKLHALHGRRLAEIEAYLELEKNETEG